MTPLGTWWTSRAHWLRCLICFGLGALSVLAHAPIDFAPAILALLFPAFLLAREGAKRRSVRAIALQAFCLLWGFYVAGLYWLGHAIATDLARFWWLMPFAVLGLPALLAALNLPALLLSVRLRLSGWSLVFGLSGLWLAADWIRSVVFSGFPWNMIGQIWANHSVPAQLASIGGVWGLTALTCVIGFTISHGLMSQGARQRLVAAGLVVATLTSWWGFGAYRLTSEGAYAQQSVGDSTVRLVQPVIAQNLKWDPEQLRANVAQQIALSTAPSSKFPNGPSHVIWSEAAVPYSLAENPEYRAQLAQAVLGENGVQFLTGGNRIVRTGTGFTAQDVTIWNSLFSVGHDGTINASYDKSHLVPFGEYIPLRGLIEQVPAMNEAMPGAVDFSEGPGPTTISIPGLPPVSVNICYESIFPGRVQSRAGDAELIITITNDGWFGMTSGPHQHLAQAKLRSIEEGLPQLRVSNPGISAIVDYLGRERGRLDLGEVGYLDGEIPVYRLSRTVFARIGNRSLVILLIVFAAAALATRAKS